MQLSLHITSLSPQAEIFYILPNICCLSKDGWCPEKHQAWLFFDSVFALIVFSWSKYCIHYVKWYYPSNRWIYYSAYSTRFFLWLLRAEDRHLTLYIYTHPHSRSSFSFDILTWSSSTIAIRLYFHWTYP